MPQVELTDDDTLLLRLSYPPEIHHLVWELLLLLCDCVKVLVPYLEALLPCSLSRVGGWYEAIDERLTRPL